jgi:hypothetical protein
MDKQTLEHLQDLKEFIEEAVGFADEELSGDERVEVVDFLDDMNTSLVEFIARL